MSAAFRGIAGRVRFFALAMSALILLLIVGGGATWKNQNSTTSMLQEHLNRLLGADLETLELVSDLQLHVSRLAQDFLVLGATADAEVERSLQGQQAAFEDKLGQLGVYAKAHGQKDLLTLLDQVEHKFASFLALGAQGGSQVEDQASVIDAAHIRAIQQNTQGIQSTLQQMEQVAHTELQRGGAELGDVFQSMLQGRLILVGIILLSGVGAFGAIWLCTILLSRFLVTPVTALTETVLAFSRQEYDHEIPCLTRKDEIGEIARELGVLGKRSEEAQRLQQQTLEEQERRLEQERLQRKALEEVENQKNLVQEEQRKREEEEAAALRFKQEVHHILECLESIRSGNLQTVLDLSVEGDLGKIAEGIDQLQQTLKDSMGLISGNSLSLSGASSQMKVVCESLDTQAGQNTHRAEEVNQRYGEVSSRIRSVSGSTAELANSIREIARNAANGQSVAQDAVRSTQTANQTISSLHNSSAEIESVIKTITAIAEQTNLLALNATIEAARAGEAGKGFAVVANEVKELAKETAIATEDIGRKIIAIQTDTAQAVKAIGSTTETIEGIHAIQTSIAAAVEEQSATTAEINNQIEDVNRLGDEILDHTKNVVEAARQTQGQVHTIVDATDSLEGISIEFGTLVSRFRFENR